jgi:hypothetical protein
VNNVGTDWKDALWLRVCGCSAAATHRMGKPDQRESHAPDLRPLSIGLVIAVCGAAVIFFGSRRWASDERASATAVCDTGRVSVCDCLGSQHMEPHDLRSYALSYVIRVEVSRSKSNSCSATLQYRRRKAILAAGKISDIRSTTGLSLCRWLLSPLDGCKGGCSFSRRRQYLQQANVLCISQRPDVSPKSLYRVFAGTACPLVGSRQKLR